MIGRTTTALLLAALVAGVSHAQQRLPLNVRYMDTTCAPCADFYQYANGAWMRQARLTAGQLVTMPAMEAEMHHPSANLVAEVIRVDADSARRSAARPGSARWKVGTLYNDCTDTVTVQRVGKEFLAEAFEKIDDAGRGRSVGTVLAMLDSAYDLGPWNVDIESAPDAWTHVSLSPGGWTMDDAGDYLAATPAAASRRERLREHMSAMLRIGGRDSARAEQDALGALAIETALARWWTRRTSEARDSAIGMSIATLAAMTPHLPWGPVLFGIVPALNVPIEVEHVEFFRALDSLVAAEPSSSWRSYLRWRVLEGASEGLDEQVAREEASFHSGADAWSGSRAARCIELTNRLLGWLVAPDYAQRALSSSAQRRASKVMNEVAAAMGRRIRQSAFDSTTKREALNKLAAMTREIGIPADFPAESDKIVLAGHFAESVERISWADKARSHAQVGSPRDRTLRTLMPQTAQGRYLRDYNKVVFTVAGLRAFYDSSGDDASVYGALGAVIGHEIAHGFDSEGRHYDATGARREWWTPEAESQYDRGARKIVAQFDSYTVVDSVTHVNGTATLAENIADLLGLEAAYDAFTARLSPRAAQRRTDGFTPVQRFFLSWAQQWAQVASPEFVRRIVSTNVHAPLKWHVNGPLSNMPEFAKAWGCHEGESMVRPAVLRPVLW